MRVKTPTLLQMDRVECGSVSLAIILGYFGHHVSTAAMREACDVTRDGSQAINLIKVAQQYGLEAHGMPLTIEQVRQLPPPFIVYWESNHFLVVDGFHKQTVYLNDPATGPRTVTDLEFNRSFSNVALVFVPGDHFEKSGEAEKSTFKTVRDYLSGLHSGFVYLLAMALLWVIPQLALAFFTKIFIDYIWLDGQMEWLFSFLGAMLLAAFFIGLLTLIKRRGLIRLSMTLKLNHMSRFFWRLLHLPLSFFNQRAIGDIAARIESNASIASVLTHELFDTFTGLLAFIVFMTVIFLFSVPLGLISVSLIMINAGILWFFSKKMSDLSRRHAQLEGKLASIESRGIQIIETLKADGLENHFFNHWAAYQSQKINHAQQVEKADVWIRLSPLLLQGLNGVIVLIIGSCLIMQGQLSVGSLVAIQILLLSLQNPMNALLTWIEDMRQLTGKIARIEDIYQEKKVDILSSTPQQTIHPSVLLNQPILILDKVTFGYSQLESPILSDLSISMKPGECVAIVGPLGAGKSSVSKLICGLYKPWSGEIMVQGQALSKISRAVLADCVALVGQQIILFSGTIRDNLTLWDSSISDQRMFAALDMVEMTNIVVERGGLDGWVAERGCNFSGGQIQQLEIARALIRNPRLLILDAATTALDSLTEEKILTRLKKQGYTLLIITHRHSMMKDYDQVIEI